MSYFVYLAAVGSIIFSTAHCNDNIPPPIIVAYEPFGIQVFLTDTDGVSKVDFYANINRKLKKSDVGDIFLEATEPNEDGEWIIMDEEYELKIGDIIYYTLFVKKFDTSYKLEGLSYEIKDMIPSPTTIPITAVTTSSTLPPTTSTNRPMTQTTTLTASTAAPLTQTSPSTTPTTTLTTSTAASTTPPTSSPTKTTSPAVSTSPTTPVTVPPLMVPTECGDNIYVDIDVLLPTSLGNFEKDKYYSVPIPEIVVYETGFHVSIPDEPGIELLYFHGLKGSANASLEADAITMGTRERTGRKWVVYDNSTSFTNGDFLQYWLYVKRNGLGYRMNSGYYEVGDILPYQLNATTAIQAGVPCLFKKPSPPATATCSSFCQSEMNNITQTLTKLQSEVNFLKNVTKALLHAVGEANDPSYYEKWTWE